MPDPGTKQRELRCLEALAELATWDADDLVPVRLAPAWQTHEPHVVVVPVVVEQLVVRLP